MDKKEKSKIVILVAMEKERDLIRDVIPESEDIVVETSGIGKVNAALATQTMILTHRPALIISAGVAGALEEDLEPLDVVVSSRSGYHDVWCGEGIEVGEVSGCPRYFDSDPRIVVMAQQMRLPTGFIATGDWFVEGKKMAEIVRMVYPFAKAADMESAAIGQVCHRYNCPYISFRIISDNPFSGEGLTQYNDFWERLSKGSMDTLAYFVAKCRERIYE